MLQIIVKRLLAVCFTECETSWAHFALMQLTALAQTGFDKSVQSDAEMQSRENSGIDLIAHEYCEVVSNPAPVIVISVIFVRYAALGRKEIQLSCVSRYLSATLPPLVVSEMWRTRSPDSCRRVTEIWPAEFEAPQLGKAHVNSFVDVGVDNAPLHELSAQAFAAPYTVVAPGALKIQR